MSEDYVFSNKLSVNGMVQAGELILNWTYSDKHYEKETIAELVKNYQSNLESLIAHCIAEGKSGTVFTPSDYGLGSEISYEELDRFLNEKYKDSQRKDWIEGLYRLADYRRECYSMDFMMKGPEHIFVNWDVTYIRLT